MLMPEDQNAGQNNNIKTDNKFFGSAGTVSYFGANLSSQNSIQEEIKSSLKLGNAFHHSAQNLLSSSLLSSSTKVEKYRAINLPVVLYECESWSLTQREEHRLRMSENRVLGRIFGPQGNEVRGEWRTLHEEELNDVCSSPNIVRVIKSRRIRWAGYVVCVGWGIQCFLVGKPEGRKTQA
jgi:hypothetical protein